MRRALLSGLALALLAASPAAAEVGTGPPVSVTIPVNVPLGGALHARVAQDDPARPYGATVAAALRVGGRAAARLAPAEVAPSAAPVELVLPVGAGARTAVRAAAKRAHTRRITVTFVVTAHDPRTGANLQAVGEDSYATLDRGVRVRGPVGLSLRRELVRGEGGQTLRRTAVITPPASWTRTSSAGATTATFWPLPDGPGCDASVFVFPTAVAAGSITGALASFGGARGAHTAAGGWALRPGAPAAAIGLRRVARHRYAGVRLYVQQAAWCPPQAPLAAPLRRALERLVAGVRVTA